MNSADADQRPRDPLLAHEHRAGSADQRRADQQPVVDHVFEHNGGEAEVDADRPVHDVENQAHHEGVRGDAHESWRCAEH